MGSLFFELIHFYHNIKTLFDGSDHEQRVSFIIYANMVDFENILVIENRDLESRLKNDFQQLLTINCN